MIPPLTEDEQKTLEDTILEDGRIYFPLIVWNNTIIDGHNRYRILQKLPTLRYEIREKDFADREEAKAWICKNQLGRRNLTPEQKKYLIGKQFESEKSSQGGNHGNQYTALPTCQVGTLATKADTAERIAKENGIGRRSVYRAEAFSKAVDIADEIEPGIRSEFLNGNIKVTEKDIRALAIADLIERPAIIAELRNLPKKRNKPSKTDKPLTEMQQIGRDMLTARSKGTAEDMTYELNDALESLKFRWLFAIENNPDYYADKVCRQEINALAQSGVSFFHNTIKGEILNELRAME